MISSFSICIDQSYSEVDQCPIPSPLKSLCLFFFVFCCCCTRYMCSLAPAFFNVYALAWLFVLLLLFNILHPHKGLREIDVP